MQIDGGMKRDSRDGYWSLRWRALSWRARDLMRLAFTGHARKVWRTVARRIYSNSASLGLHRDITVPFAAPAARVPIAVRPLAPDDDLSCLDFHEPGLSDDEVFDRLGETRLLQSGIPTCHVAVGPQAKPAYMEWLITPKDYERVHAFFGNLYPTLAPDEVLLEGGYTPGAYRGKGVMPSAVAQIAERAGDMGARWVITFVDEGNVGYLKGAAKAGFVPYVRRREEYRLFRRRVTFVPLAAQDQGPGP